MIYLGQITRYNNEANYLDPKSRSLELFFGFSVWDPKWHCCQGLQEFLPCAQRGSCHVSQKISVCLWNRRKATQKHVLMACRRKQKTGRKQEGHFLSSSSHVLGLESEPSHHQMASPQPPTTTTTGPLEVRQRLYKIDDRILRQTLPFPVASMR